jgi:hypothetical protein
MLRLAGTDLAALDKRTVIKLRIQSLRRECMN